MSEFPEGNLRTILKKTGRNPGKSSCSNLEKNLTLKIETLEETQVEILGAALRNPGRCTEKSRKEFWEQMRDGTLRETPEETRKKNFQKHR